MQISADTFIKDNFSQIGKSFNELFDWSLHHPSGRERLVSEGLPPVLAVEDDGDDLPVPPRYRFRQTVLATQVKSGQRATRLNDNPNHGVVAVLREGFNKLSTVN